MGKKLGGAKLTVEELGGWNEVDEALRQIADCDREVAEITNELNENINKLKKKSEMQAVAFINSKNTLSAQIESFVTEHKNEIAGKTKFLNFGKVGFRKSVNTTYSASKAADIIESLKLQSMHKCINVKETINKTVLGTYPNDILAKLGVKKVEKDTFFYETDTEEIKS
ncbi:hypothetical protein AGMMS49975_15610 [Clostridia bacterium]|nr:hypothetical protein AGMMS49975_15610 [Clostridia bacterium]